MAEAKLYGLPFSHPSICARLALERKGVETEVVDVLPGLHPVAVRALGFPANTVPALKIDGTRVQGSRNITAHLEATRPDPPLFGTTAAERGRIEAAEEWGDRHFQPIPRKIFRLGATREPEVMEFVTRVGGMPAPAVMARLARPVATVLARAEGATEATVREVLNSLSADLDHVDGLIADGTLGGEQPNAADFQILTTVRSMMTLPDLEPFLAGRECVTAAQRVVPEMPGPVPSMVPPEWVAEAVQAKDAA